MKIRNLYILILIGLIAATVFFSVLFGTFVIFPLFCAIPLICGLRRGFEQNRENQQEQGSGYQERRSSTHTLQVVEISPGIKEGFCSNCNNKIEEQNLRFCPHCGSKL